MFETVLVVGGTGAMGRAVVRKLLTHTSKKIRVLTRDASSARALALTVDGGERIELVEGDLDDQPRLSASMSGVDQVFCNTDFWSTGSPAREYDQGLSALAAARANDVQHFIWSSLDSAVSLTDGAVAVPHFDAKAAVASWIDLKRSDEFMRRETNGWFSNHVSILVTAPYYENLQFRVLPRPTKLTDGRHGLSFDIALGAGRYPMIALEDIGWFARMMLEDTCRWGGQTLRAVGDAPTGLEIATRFEAVTGIASEYRDVPLATIRSGLPDTGHDVAAMFEFFQRCDVVARAREPDRLKELHPGLLDFDQWLRRTGWRGQATEVQKLAVQLPH